MRKLPPQALAANILVGAMENISKPVTAFVRLQEPHVLGEFTEVTVPTKFVFFHLTPGDNSQKNRDVGRSIGAMLADGVSLKPLDSTLLYFCFSPNWIYNVKYPIFQYQSF